MLSVLSEFMRKGLGLFLYFIALFGVIASVNGGGNHGLFGWIAILIVLWPFFTLVYLRDDRPMMWALNSSMATSDYILGYVKRVITRNDR
jgi:hypothetical protein